MNDSRKILCVADASPECRTAILFAAERAKRNGSGLVILKVVRPIDNSLVASLGAGVMEELRLEGLSELQELSRLAQNKTGIIPELITKDIEIHQALREIITADSGIKTLLLGASVSKKGPGPLVSEITGGKMNFGSRPIAIMIVPENLTDEQITELAS